MSKKKDRNYWPHGILALILAVVFGGALSVREALKHPVQESNYFMKKYQDFEDHAYDLEKQKDEFDKNFFISYSIKKLRIGQNHLKLKIKNRLTDKPVDGAKIELLLTRPDTTKLDKKVKLLNSKNGTYIFEDLNISRLGRWQIYTTTRIKKYRGFNSYDINATRK